MPQDLMGLSEMDSEVAAIRKPPQSYESEQSVLGGLMLDSNAYDLIAEVLSPEDFYRREHRLIYETIVKLVSESKPVDVVTVFGELQATNQIDDVGGMPYLNTLVNSTPTAANIRRYAEIVRERSILRQLITTGDDIATMALSTEGMSVVDLLDKVQQMVFDIDESNNKGKRNFQKLADLATEVTEELRVLTESKTSDDVTGIPTSFIDIDRMLAGLQRGDLIIVAGRPSMGKTAFALNIAEHVGLNMKLPVAVFSMEMSGPQLAKRLISSVGRIDAQKLRRAQLNDDEWSRYSEVVSLMSGAPIFIDDTPGLTVNELRSRARRLVRQSGALSLIVVDYLQLMSGTSHGRNTENRATEIAEISRGLKNLAKEMKVPVIALSQLNRTVESASRKDKRPMLSDLRESGSIEQDADVIMFIYRDVVYNKDTKDKNVAEIIIGKQRSGPVGTVRLRFGGEFTRFDNLAKEGEYE